MEGAGVVADDQAGAGEVGVVLGEGGFAGEVENGGVRGRGWGLDSLGVGRWTLGVGRWTLDVLRVVSIWSQRGFSSGEPARTRVVLVAQDAAGDFGVAFDGLQCRLRPSGAAGDEDGWRGDGAEEVVVM